MKYLLLRISKDKLFDGNKLYASEILSILLQDIETNHKKLVELDGIEILLQSISAYRKKDPESTEESEMLANLFDCLCSVLLLEENKKVFLEKEGLELMLIPIREKKHSSKGAFKVLDYALGGNVTACLRFIDQLGLKSLFAGFMGKGKHMKSKKGSEGEVVESEEHIIAIIATLFNQIGTDHSQYHERLLNKFKENDYEKVDRLLDLHLKYKQKLDLYIKEYPVDEEDETDADELYLLKLENGLFTLQLVDLILSHIFTSKDKGIQDRIKLLMHQYDVSLSYIRDILQEYVDNIGPSDPMAEENKSDKGKSKEVEIINNFKMKVLSLLQHLNEYIPAEASSS